MHTQASESTRSELAAREHMQAALTSCRSQLGKSEAFNSCSEPNETLLLGFSQPQ